MVVGPILVATVYLVLSRYLPSVNFEVADYLALAASVSVGLYALVLLPLTSLNRLAIATIYVPVTTGIVIVYTLYFVCFIFRDCL